jgi:hypothetical protein
MKRAKSSERGQALVIIAVGMIALLALTALSIDGGNAYSDRRHAQNAADTSALAAALARIRGQDIFSAGFSRAADNGYDNNGTTNTVEIHSPPTSGLYSCNGSVGWMVNPDTGEQTCNEYIQVFVTSHIKTWFAPLIGVPQVTNNVESVARAIEGGPRPIYGGHAVASMSPTDCKSVTFQGGAGLVLNGSGLYVNSTCYDTAFFNNSNAGGLTAPCLYVVGGIEANPNVINIPSSCTLQHQPAQPGPTLPEFACDSPSTFSGAAPDKTMTPGYWDGNGNKDFPPTGVKYLNSGIYCVYNADFKMNANQTLIGHDVVIYIRDGGVTWNGGANITLDAPGGNDPNNCDADGGPYKGLLLYLDKNNHNGLSLAGGGALFIQGTILAPGSTCSISGGGSASAPLQTQIVCNNVEFTGSSNSYINYDPCLTYAPMVLPVLQQTK